MRFPAVITLVAAVLVVVLVVFVGLNVLQPDLPLITAAAFSLDTITPNADGAEDVTVFSYELSDSANITLSFTAEDGQTFVYRNDLARSAGEYQVQFSGVVDGFTLPDDTYQGTIERRLMPDGAYTWLLSAHNPETDEQDERTGQLTLREGNIPLPDILEFTFAPTTFTPNQDGLSDRITGNVFLTQPADLTVYLIGANGEEFVIPERFEQNLMGEAGRHSFDYDGGVDQGANPPADGTYTLIASAQDAVGQRVVRSTEITIEEGGKPVAQIVTQASGINVVFDSLVWNDRFTSTRETAGELIDIPNQPESLNLSTVVMQLGDMLVFKVTVSNIGSVPVRTTGPEPGTVYTWDQNASTLGWFEEAGAWRIGIDCETAPRDYPWRWGLGNQENLIERVDPANGVSYYYLPAGEQVVVWGAIRMTELEVVNPQACWAGLIHESVAVSEFNSRVGSRQIDLVADAGIGGN